MKKQKEPQWEDATVYTRLLGIGDRVDVELLRKKQQQNMATAG